MTIAIFGARGDIGKHLLVPLLQKLGTVFAVSRTSSPAELDQAWSADVIWLSVPRDAIDGMVTGRTLRSDQLVVDVCSLKRRLSEVVKPTGAAHLSLHPLHGPHVPLSGQKWAVITSYSDHQHPHISTTLAFLRKHDIHFLTPCAEDEHDFMLGLTLSMPELLTVFIDELIAAYARQCGRVVPDFKTLMEWAVPASNALFSAYIHSINSSAEWLRKDLVVSAHGDLLAAAKAAAERVTAMSIDDLSARLQAQHVSIEAVPLTERKRVRQWIERWFVDSTQKVFSFHQKKQHVPQITIQDAAPAEQVFPHTTTPLRVGIHGIAGSFTHESMMRLCETLGVSTDGIEPVYLVESQNVINAVLDGSIDRGVVAFANSGSGAYVSTMRAVSSSVFEIVAIYGMEILQCLLAHPSVTSIDQVRRVFGHPQAVSQCKRTFVEKYPEIILEAGQDSDDTALCAQRIAEGVHPADTATLASQTAARLYGLNIVEYGMHHDPFNTTTFMVIKKRS